MLAIVGTILLNGVICQMDEVIVEILSTHTVRLA